MKPSRKIILSCCSVACCGGLSARDLVPVYHFEDIPGADGSTLKCLVVRTVAGVSYRTETSADLETWSPGTTLYGMGHEFVIPVREISPPDPGAGGSGPPAYLVPLRVQRATGGAGTVVTWPSLDNQEGMTALVPEQLYNDWNSTPFYAGRHGDYQFFIWNPGSVAAPPVSPPAPFPKDAAMLAAFDAHFDDMNLAVAESVAQARNSPYTSPALTGDRKFWRIHADWSVDTDHDDVPDWEEYEIAANPQHPDHGLSDPFNGDANDNGINDGQEVDFDGDGIMNEADASQIHGEVDWQRGPSPRFALFDLAGSPSPGLMEGRAIHVTDQGYVLYPEGVWANGEYGDLTLADGFISQGKAFAMSPTGRIIGRAQADFTEDGAPDQGVLVQWDGPQGSPQLVEASSANGKIYASPGYDMLYQRLDPGTLIDSGGAFFANATPLRWVDYDPEVLEYELDPPLGNQKWNLPASGGADATYSGAPAYATNLADGGLVWGPDYTDEGKLLLSAGRAEFKAGQRHSKVAPTPGGGYLAMGNALGPAFGLQDGQWSKSQAFKGAVDMSKQGWVILNNARIWANGSEMPLGKAAPGLSPTWTNSFVDLLDMSPAGNVLAIRYAPSGDPVSYGLAVPFHLEDATIETGVDSVSCTVQNTKGAMDKHWIMAPQGGENTLFVRSTACPTCALALSSAGASIQPSSILSEQSLVTVAGNAAAGDYGVTVGLGSHLSSASPIGVKVMKKRNVKVTVHKIASVTEGENGREVDPPNLELPAAVIEEYLNKIYGPQINVNFSVAMNPPEMGVFHELNWDTSSGANWNSQDRRLPIGQGGDLSVEEKFISDSFMAVSSHINIYMVGGANPTPLINLNGTVYLSWRSLATGRPARNYAAAHSSPNNMVFVNADSDLYDIPAGIDPLAELKNTLAHEIGHVIVAMGHPDEGAGAAPLVGTRHQDRLMVSGGKVRRPDFGELLVKAEWDAAEDWLSRTLESPEDE